MKPDPATEPGAGAGSQGGRDRLDREIERVEAASGRYVALRLASFVALVLGLCASVPTTIYWIWTFTAAAVFCGSLLLHLRLQERQAVLERGRLLRTERRMRGQSRRHHRPAPRVGSEAGPLETGWRLYAPEPESFALDDGVIDDLNLLSSPSGPTADGQQTPRTIFGFLDWSSSTFGARRLRHMLLHPLWQEKDIRDRQEAVREMAENDGARNRLLGALLPLRDHTLEPLFGFFSEPLTFAGRKVLLWWAHLLGTLIPAGIIAMAVRGDLEFLGFVVILVLLSLGTIGLHVKDANRERDRILLFGPLFDAWLRLRDALRVSKPAAAHWRTIAGVLDSIHPYSRRLRFHVNLLALHDYGVIFEIVNVLTLWELRILPHAAALFERQKKHLERAAGALGEAEALACLSLPLAEQEGFEMPEPVTAERPQLHAGELGHPLIERAACVRNPLQLDSERNVLLVTGSNMAGKSTYLKSVATNLLLAGMGGPVCARDFRWTPLALYTDVNVRDSLDDGKSYFQVEVERVKQVVEAAGKSPFLLAVFDELFRGTNSVERLALARAIVCHLRSAGVLALVATHDLALTTLAEEETEHGIANRHFQETIEGGEMRFDYRLRDGPATSRNAIRLLEAYGYPLEITRQAHEIADG